MSKVQYEATVSMFAYCTQVLHLSECETFLRIAAARASRKHPVLLEMLRDGRLHLSGIERLARHFTSANRDMLLKRAAYKTKKQIDEMLAEVFPKPDVATTVRKLPEPRPTPQPTPGPNTPPQVGPDRVAPPVLELSPAPVAPSAPKRLEQAAPPTVPTARKPTHVEPLAAARYRVTFTASAELCEKLDRLQSLMRSSVPDGDLARLIEAAVTEKLERLEARRFSKTAKPRKTLDQTDTTPTTRHIPAPIRRAVHERDGGRCRFVDESGRRCKARDNLQFHHDHAYGRGGDHSQANVMILCASHNQYLADLEYGKDVMDRHRDGVSEAVAVYSVGAPTPRRLPNGPGHESSVNSV